TLTLLIYRKYFFEKGEWQLSLFLYTSVTIILNICKMRIQCIYRCFRIFCLNSLKNSAVFLNKFLSLHIITYSILHKKPNNFRNDYKHQRMNYAITACFNQF